MKSLIPFIISLLIAGSEPFAPLGSPAIALAAVLGVRYPNSVGLIAAILIGLIRDVLLVNRLGISSFLCAAAWLVAAVGVTRLGRPAVISVAAAILAAIPAGFFPGPWSYQSIFGTAILAGVFSLVWNHISETDEKIRVRK